MITISGIFLILVNLIPLVGVLVLKWNIGSIMVLYWSENIVVGIYNILKMAQATGKDEKPVLHSKGKPVTNRWGLIFFFIFHYGFFTLGHGIFVFVFFKKSAPVISAVFPVFIMLFISHGISYRQNFIKSGEYKRVSFQKLFSQPYKRIVIMHITIIATGTSVQGMGSPLLPLLLMVVLKTGIDSYAHIREHKKFGVK